MALVAPTRPATVGDSLAEAAERFRASGTIAPRLTAETLLAHVLGVERVYLYAHPEHETTRDEAARFEALVARREAGEPTQYLTGVQEFYGRAFRVTPDVLIPRPETEHLVEAVLAAPGKHVLDMATGSGAIGVTLALELSDARVFASDLSRAALAVAADNAGRLGAQVEFLASDYLTAMRAGSFDLIACNPPYVAESAELQPEIALEPRSAVFGGEFGWEPYGRVIPQAAQMLKPGGRLVLELGHDSLTAVREFYKAGPWSKVTVTKDLAGIARVAAAERI